MSSQKPGLPCQNCTKQAVSTPLLLHGRRSSSLCDFPGQLLLGRWPAGSEPKYPVCFLTNGGGMTEAQKAEQLSSWLDVSVTEDQVSLFHSVKPHSLPACSSLWSLPQAYASRVSCLIIPYLHAGRPFSHAFQGAGQAIR